LSFEVGLPSRSGDAFILARASAWQGVATTPMRCACEAASRWNAASVGEAAKFDPAQASTPASSLTAVPLGSRFSSLEVRIALSITPSRSAKATRALTVPPYWPLARVASCLARDIKTSRTTPSSASPRGTPKTAR
jgi:hypothetical protein